MVAPTRRIHLSTALALLALALLPACASRPRAPVPAPLPELEAWALAVADGGFVGLRTEENDSGSLDSLFFDPGVRVREVVPNSPAAAAGFEPGDVVLAVGEDTIDDPAAFESLLAAAPVGEPVSLEVQRGDTAYAVELSPVARQGSGTPPEVLWRLDPARTRGAWMTTPDGLRLVSLADDSPLLEADLRVGDIVRSVDGTAVHSARALLRELQTREPGSTVTLGLSRDGEPDFEREITLLAEPTVLTSVGIPILFHWDQAVDGSTSSWAFIDLWLFSLFDYERVGREKTWRMLSLFSVSTGQGELDA